MHMMTCQILVLGQNTRGVTRRLHRVEPRSMCCGPRPVVADALGRPAGYYVPRPLLMRLGHPRCYRRCWATYAERGRAPMWFTAGR